MNNRLCLWENVRVQQHAHMPEQQVRGSAARSQHSPTTSAHLDWFKLMSADKQVSKQHRTYKCYQCSVYHKPTNHCIRPQGNLIQNPVYSTRRGDCSGLVLWDVRSLITVTGRLFLLETDTWKVKHPVRMNAHIYTVYGITWTHTIYRTKTNRYW